MCGLFGMTLPTDYPKHLINRGHALTLLGELAEERGRDAAGMAARHPRPAPTGEPRTEWRLDKCAGPFNRLARTARLAAALVTAQTALGHTRRATQGDRGIRNASPAIAETLLCTHNGDVDIDTVPYRPEHIRAGSTDSSVLFAALATAHTGRVNVRRIVKILSQTHGRAALVWTDTAQRGGRVWLARAGLSPLAIGHDLDGGLWWASNPTWLRELGDVFDLPFRSTSLLPEGTLLAATPLKTSVKVTVHARFKPTVRPFDQRLVPTAVWRNFTPGDKDDDLAVMRHRVAAPTLPLRQPAGAR